MNPQIGTIHGQLCIMLEKPVPLTKDAKLPCVVRLIQDDSLIGMHTAQYPETRQRSIIITALDQFGKVVSDKKILYNNCWPGWWFEILGYPVVDGSPEWAWYQMSIGNKVIPVENQQTPWYLDNGRAETEISSASHTFEKWVEVASQYSWQLYEPKPPKEPNYITCSKCGGTGHEIAPEPEPLLANAKKGDLCQLRNGEWVQLIKTNDTTHPTYPSHQYLYNAKNGAHVSTIHGMVSCDCTTNMEHDIIHWEPLAREGSVEWAGQMLKLGKKVINECNEYPHSLGTNGKVYLCCQFRIGQGSLQDWVKGRSAEAGWQLYTEPEPEPRFAVGEYALFQDKPVEIIEIRDKGDIYEDAATIQYLDGKIFPAGVKLFALTPLKPSEVVVHIGCLKGTVKKCVATNGLGFEMFDKNRNIIAWISYDALDPQTSQLVEKLLAAQQKEIKE